MLRPTFTPLLFAALLSLGLATDAHAQSGGMPSDIEWKLSALGATINPAEIAKLYAPLQEKEPYQGIKVTRDLKYGTDERHALDVFVPDPAGASRRPVLMFVHGGGFTDGDKRIPDSPFYDNIALFAARNGLVGVNATSGHYMVDRPLLGEESDWWREAMRDTMEPYGFLLVESHAGNQMVKLQPG